MSGADEHRKAALRAGLSLVAAVFCGAAAGVRNGLFTWECDSDCIGQLYFERSCVYQSNCYNSSNSYCKGCEKGYDDTDKCNHKLKCVNFTAMSIGYAPGDYIGPTCANAGEPRADGSAAITAGGPCLDLLNQGVGWAGPQPRGPTILKLDFKCGIFTSEVYGKAKDTFTAIDGLTDAGILCDDYKEAARTAQAFCMTALVSLVLLAVQHGRTAAGHVLYGEFQRKTTAFLHFSATFMALMSTVWVPITFQTLEPCEFNYHTLKEEPGAKIGIGQYLFMIATLCQFVVIGMGPGLPPMDPLPPPVQKYIPVPRHAS